MVAVNSVEVKTVSPTHYKHLITGNFIKIKPIKNLFNYLTLFLKLKINRFSRQHFVQGKYNNKYIYIID